MPKRAEPTGFAARLKQLREGAALTQDELAAKVGFHKMSISKLEQGIREPTWATVLALAAALGVGVEAFAQPPAEPAEPRPRGRPRKGEEAPVKKDAEVIKPPKGKKGAGKRKEKP